MKKNGFRAVGLSVLAVLGLMAFVAAGAQANWLENKVETTANKEVKVSTHVTPVLDVPADELEISCTSMAGEDALIVAKSAEVTGSLKFTGCTTKKSGVEQKLCKPAEPIKATGIGKIVLDIRGNELLFTPFFY